MKKELKDNFFSLIRDFFTIYLLNQKKLSQNTISSYRDTMNQFIMFICSYYNVDIMEIEFKIITAEAVEKYIEWMESRENSEVTINQRLSAIRSFYKYASIMDVTKLTYRNEIYKVPLRKMNPKMKELKYLQKKHVQLLLDMPDHTTKKGIRDLLIMTLLYDGALRVGEIRNLKIKDIKNIDSVYISVRGKGNKYRNVPISDKTIIVLNKYIKIYHVEMNPDDYLIYTIIHDRKHMMSDDNINYIIKKYAKKAYEKDNTMPTKVSSHIFRHSRSIHLYQGGMPLPLISQWLGHENLETTLIYAYADTEMKRTAIMKAELIDKDGDEEFDLLNSDVENRETILKKLYGLK